ncbi:pentapeptide repeat-containing protein [Nostoc sp. CALU 546]|uniref:pentapeptide repeat-containing protein n=1 Tax=Nostoc sp. CALU 546 TaxID=1867241 RepID=UPI003B675703
MSDNKTDPLRNWLIVLPFIFIVCLFIVFLAFVNVEGLSIEQRLDYGIKALTTTGTIFVGIAVFINAFYAAKRAEALDKSAEAANKSAEAANKTAEAALKNAEAAQDKQITERFAKAVEQLGNEKIETRLGAIYTLERIAKDSPKDHWTIMEVLTAFVRENAPLKDFSEKNTDLLIIVNTLNYQKSKEIEEKLKLQTDIQAALTVIGRRKSENELENQSLDLNNVDIRGAILYKANLQGANLKGANLQGAPSHKLQGANLIEANLQGASYLNKANLQGANLYKANLQGANLIGAENLEQEQIELAKGDRTTILPENLQPPKHWKAQL